MGALERAGTWFEFAEELRARGLEILITSLLPAGGLNALPAAGLSVIMPAETDHRHPRLTSLDGLRAAGVMAGRFLRQTLPTAANILTIGGGTPYPDSGRPRLEGFWEGLGLDHNFKLRHLAAAWQVEEARLRLGPVFKRMRGRFDAVFALSDPLVLLARELAQARGLVGPEALFVGVNGDPNALSAVAEGRLAATIDLETEGLAREALELAVAVGRGRPMPKFLPTHPRLVTRSDVGQTALRKLNALSELPSQMVGLNSERERRRLRQLEQSVALSRRMTELLSREALEREIPEAIRRAFGYDLVRWWRVEGDRLQADHPPFEAALDGTGPLEEAARRKAVVFVPNTWRSGRFPCDPLFPETVTRTILPVRSGAEWLGLLDLHGHEPAGYGRGDLLTLEGLAHQFGTALHNAQLFEEELFRRRQAESASQYKSERMLALSQALREPLQTVLGRSQAALEAPSLYGGLSDPIAEDLNRIHHAGRQLAGLLGELLETARDEQDALAPASETASPVAEPAILLVSSLEQPPQQLPDTLSELRAKVIHLNPSKVQAVPGSVTPVGMVWWAQRPSPSEVRYVEALRQQPGLAGLPFHRLTPPTPFSPPREPVEYSGPAADQRPLLVADPSAQAREVYAGWWAQVSPTAKTIVVANGAEAIAVLEREVPRLVLLDLELNPVDGFAVLAWLRSHQHTRSVPLMALTDRALGENEAPLLDYPAVIYGCKALLSEGEILSLIRGSLDPQQALPQRASTLVKRAVAYLQSHHARTLSRGEVAAALNVSQNHLSHIFRQELGLTPWEFLNRYRVWRARGLMESSSLSVGEITSRVGFEDPSYFARVFRRSTGLAPQAYRRATR